MEKDASQSASCGNVTARVVEATRPAARSPSVCRDSRSKQLKRARRPSNVLRVWPAVCQSTSRQPQGGHVSVHRCEPCGSGRTDHSVLPEVSVTDKQASGLREVRGVRGAHGTWATPSAGRSSRDRAYCRNDEPTKAQTRADQNPQRPYARGPRHRVMRWSHLHGDMQGVASIGVLFRSRQAQEHVSSKT